MPQNIKIFNDKKLGVQFPYSFGLNYNRLINGISVVVVGFLKNCNTKYILKDVIVDGLNEFQDLRVGGFFIHFLKHDGSTQAVYSFGVNEKLKIQSQQKLFIY